jgi:protein SCO1/2
MTRLAFAARALLMLIVTAAWGPLSPEDLSWRPAPGTQLPLDVTARDESGNAVKLGDFLTRVPVVLDLGYYHCPSLCSVARADLIQALDNSGLVSGRDYALVALSIDPRETPRDAAAAKAVDAARAGAKSEPAWHYLTAGEPTIATIEGNVGFRARYDPGLDQYLHPAGLVVLTARGVVSGYLTGVGYSAGDMRAAVLRARDGGIARAALPILLLCFHYDPTTGRYTLAILRVLQLMGLFTVGVLGGMLLLLHRRRPRT